MKKDKEKIVFLQVIYHFCSTGSFEIKTLSLGFIRYRQNPFDGTAICHRHSPAREMSFL